MKSPWSARHGFSSKALGRRWRILRHRHGLDGIILHLRRAASAPAGANAETGGVNAETMCFSYGDPMDPMGNGIYLWDILDIPRIFHVVVKLVFSMIFQIYRMFIGFNHQQ